MAQRLNVTDFKKKEATIVTYVGVERGDLILAAAKLLAKAGFKVIIVDNSLTHDIWELYYDMSPDGKKAEDEGGLIVLTDAIPDKKKVPADIVFVYSGNNVLDTPQKTDVAILALSPSKLTYTACRVAQNIYHGTKPVYIYRDYVTVKPAKLAGLMEVSEKDLDWTTVEIDPDEYEAWLLYSLNRRDYLKTFKNSLPALARIISKTLGNDANAQKATDIIMKAGGL